MYQNEQTNIHQHRTLIEHWNGTTWNIVSSPSPGHSSELNAATVARGINPLSRPRTFAAGLFSTYLYPFEVTSILLLVAAIGAIYLSRRERE